MLLLGLLMHSKLLRVYKRVFLWLRARLLMLLEVVFSEASGDNGTTRSRVVHVVVFLIAAWRLSCDHVSDVLDALIVEI